MGSGFLTGIVSIVDSTGKRVDTPNENGDFAPVELQLGDNLTPTKSTSGQMTRVRVDGGGGGGAQVLNLDPGHDGSQGFNGDGSGGATQLFPFTILFTGQDGHATYNFGTAGVAEGWLVLFDVEGAEESTLTIQNQGADLITLDASLNSKQITGIYFNDGDWRLVQVNISGGSPGPTGEQPAIEFKPTIEFPLFNDATSQAANQTSGCSFVVRPGPTLNITGIRFYWASDGNETVRCKLWNNGLTVEKTVDVVTSGTGIYEGTFGSPFVVDGEGGVFDDRYVVSVWDTAGAHYTKSGNTNYGSFCPARPFFGGRRITWLAHNLWIAGDNGPTSSAGSEIYLVEPIFAE